MPLNDQADSLIKYLRRRAKRGNPEVRRDWLYTPARVNAGGYNADDELGAVITRAKERGAADGFEFVYVYDRPPCWTCEPSRYIRDKAHDMELKREISAHERLARTSGGAANRRLATANAATLSAAQVMLGVPSVPPSSDPVIARIDKAGIAN